MNSRSTSREQRCGRCARMSSSWMFILLFIVVIETENTYANPMKDPYKCGRPICSAASKFKYLPDVRYEYKYATDIRTLFGGTSRNESTLHIKATVAVEFLSECEGVLFVEKDVSVTERVVLDGLAQREVPKSADFGKAVSEFPLR
ncbi:uncharacterized protein [Anabrus simplex]|uniref:uncharacterized protein n=1 Tax=Anabrus simplex TaxID=316456 RepID=UPI0035A2D46F